MMIKNCLILVCVLVLLASVSGCGKSKREMAGEAERVRVAAEVAAAAASAAAEKEAAADVARRDGAVMTGLKDAVSQHLKDPASVQFQRLQLNTAKTALCGLVNSKNGFGGYVGFREFVVTEAEFFVKPEGCGSVPLSHWSSRPEEGTACMQYLMATMERKLCE